MQLLQENETPRRIDARAAFCGVERFFLMIDEDEDEDQFRAAFS